MDNDKLRALAAKWRKNPGNVHMQVVQIAREQCADELEALLATEKRPATGLMTLSEGIEQGRQEGYAQGYECASADRVRELSPATELKIRIFLWLGHGHDGLYGDDGEMHCGACLCDYKRDSLDECVERARVASLETGLKALGRAAPPAKEPASQGYECASADRVRELLALLPGPDEYFYVEHRGSGNNYRGPELRFVVDRRGRQVEGKCGYENEDVFEWIKRLVTLAAPPAKEPAK